MTLSEILMAYRGMRQQAVSALRARSTRELVAMREHYDSARRNLYLHPSLWTISSRRPPAKSMLQVPLPDANDRYPIRTMARSIDRQLSEWLRTASIQLTPRERRMLDQIALAQPPIEREIARTKEARASLASVSTR